MNPYQPSVDCLSVYERLEIETPVKTLEPDLPDHFEPYKGLCADDLIDEDAILAAQAAREALPPAESREPTRHVPLLEVFGDDDDMPEEWAAAASGHASTERRSHRHHARI